MTRRSDYPGAIVVEAAHYGYGVPNRPKTFCFHTPEEPADEHPSTPEYLATTDRDASYTYFVSYLGFVFQLVPESEGAYANALEGKPAPPWSDGTNLNLQTLSLSFEGYASTIHQTMPRGSPQWRAGVNLVAHRTAALNLRLDWAIQHKDVSIYRSDCGAWNQAAFIADVKAKMQEDDMPTLDEIRGVVEEELAPVREDIAKVRGKVEQNFNQINLKTGSVQNALLAAIRAIPTDSGLAGLSDAQIAAIAEAVADEQAKRMAS